MRQRVITISRQYGSGGTEIASKLAEKLGLPLYDKNLIAKVSEESGIAKAYLDKSDDRAGSFIFSLVSAHYNIASAPMEINNIVTEDNLFLVTARTIKELATEPCIILGRCADDILKDRSIIRVFICADMQFKLERVMQRYDLTEKAAASLIRKTDKRRANYYSTYAGGGWGEASNYDICLNSSRVGIDNAVKILASFISAYNKL